MNVNWIRAAALSAVTAVSLAGLAVAQNSAAANQDQHPQARVRARDGAAAGSAIGSGAENNIAAGPGGGSASAATTPAPSSATAVPATGDRGGMGVNSFPLAAGSAPANSSAPAPTPQQARQTLLQTQAYIATAIGAARLLQSQGVHDFRWAAEQERYLDRMVRDAITLTNGLLQNAGRTQPGAVPRFRTALASLQAASQESARAVRISGPPAAPGRHRLSLHPALSRLFAAQRALSDAGAELAVNSAALGQK